MIHKLKRLTLATLATLALGGALASGAHALEFTASNTAKSHAHEHTLLSGSQSSSIAFTASGGFATVTCSTATLSGTMATGTEAKISTEQNFSGCKDSLGRSVHWVAICPMLWGVAVFGGPGAQGTVAIICGIGVIWAITTTAAGKVVCTTTVNSQTGIGPIGYENLTSVAPTNLKVILEATNVKTTTSGGFFNCGTADGEHTNGTLTGNLVVSAKNTAGESLDLKWAE